MVVNRHNLSLNTSKTNIFTISYRDFILALYDYFEQNGTETETKPGTRDCLALLLDGGTEGLVDKAGEDPMNYSGLVDEVMKDSGFMKKLRPYFLPFIRPRKSLNKHITR